MNKEDYFKYYIQGSDHYLIPRDIFNEIFEDYECFKNDCKKYKEVIDRIEKYIEKETRIYGLSMSIELETHFDNILGILKRWNK